MVLGYDFMVVSIEFLMNWTCAVRERKKSEVFNEIDSGTNYSDGQGQRGVLSLKVRVMATANLKFNLHYSLRKGFISKHTKHSSRC